jgi:hypothetical protein
MMDCFADALAENGRHVPVDLVGYLASTLVFATFYMTAMLPLRLAAIASNIAFIVYAGLCGMTPILLLHVGLLPLNMWRLFQTLRQQKGGRDGSSLRSQIATTSRALLALNRRVHNFASTGQSHEPAVWPNAALDEPAGKRRPRQGDHTRS